MAIDLFGFSIGKKDKAEEIQQNAREESFVSPDEYDGAQTVQTGGGFMGTYADFSGGIQNENQFITTYRSLALYPEVDMAIEDIVNDSIIMGTDRKPIKLDLELTDLSENIKHKIYHEYDKILSLLDMPNKGFEMFRRWYIDGRLYYHIVLDKENPRAGVKELRPIDPSKMKKIRAINKKSIYRFFWTEDTSRFYCICSQWYNRYWNKTSCWLLTESNSSCKHASSDRRCCCNL